jgi:lipoprotein-releasing system permease protein
MFSKLELFIALRYLKSKRKEKFISITAFFSLIGIMLGVATLIIVMSVMNGFRADLIDRILGINSHIKIYNNINSKNFESFSNNDSVLLGLDLAIQLSVREGDEIKIISPETNNTILGSIPRMKTYRVIGTFKSGMYEYDSATAFMPIKSAQIHFRYKDSVSALEVNVEDLEKVNGVSYEISKVLGNEGQSVSVVDWKQANSAFMGALKVERNVMFIILTLIILVATFNIISSLIMLVNDKNKQIALLRTIGTTKGSVMRIFFICGSAIGFIGTFFGAIFGVLFTLNIENIRQFIEKNFGASLFDPTVYFLSQLPSRLFISDLVIVILMSLFLSFLATLYPSYKASKTNPAEVLRYE